MDNEGVSLERLIGFHTIARRHESLYAFVARLIRSNLLSEKESRQIIPRSWLKKAFDPTDDGWPDALSILSPYLDPSCSPHSKVETEPWVPFPVFACREPERLRGCLTCFQHGYHSNAFQGDLLASCPVHDEPLISHCPHCRTPLRWKNDGYSSSAFNAFKCPRGCSLLGALHEGLDSTIANRQANLLDRHLAHIELLKAALHFVSGPVFITYPPRIEDVALEAPRLPSAGAFRAITDSLCGRSLVIPMFDRHHEQSYGDWKITVNPLPLRALDVRPSDAVLQTMDRTFWRARYNTRLPLIRPLAQSLLANLKDYVSVFRHTGPPCLSMGSYFITTEEVRALNKIIASCCDDLSPACEHYCCLLQEILLRALRRQRELNGAELGLRTIRIAQSMSAVVRLNSGLVRISGYVLGDQACARKSWANFVQSTDDIWDRR